MSVIIGILATLIILNIIIVVHEYGHYITAKKFGVAINEFSIGMGPIIFQRQKKKNNWVLFKKNKAFPENEFKFSIRALPIGGFVSLKGEENTSSDPDSFSQLNPWKKLVVFLAGAAMNMLLGLLCVTIIATAFIDVDISTKVSSFMDVKISENETLPNMSQADGLMIGDEIYEIDNRRILDINDLQYALALANKDAVDVVVIRGGEKVTLEDVHFPSREQDGLKSLMMDFRVSANEKTFGGTLKYIGTSFLSVVKMVYRSLAGLITGDIPVTSVSGIVGVTETVSDSVGGLSFADLAYFVLYLMFVLTINIGLFNVLPIPALDGGQSCVCIIEGITKKKVPAKIYENITKVFFILLLIFMAVVTVKDIWHLFV